MEQLHLNDKEKQEIIRRVEEGKPLPDKYRFLLFQDKKQVDLIWNSKTFGVANLALPFQTIETVDEPREEEPEKSDQQRSLFDMDERGRQVAGWN